MDSVLNHQNKCSNVTEVTFIKIAEGCEKHLQV